MSGRVPDDDVLSGEREELDRGVIRQCRAFHTKDEFRSVARPCQRGDAVSGPRLRQGPLEPRKQLLVSRRGARGYREFKVE